jgi:hypothetical protein
MRVTERFLLAAIFVLSVLFGTNLGHFVIGYISR